MNDSAEKVLFELCKKIDTPISLGIWLRCKHAPKELASYVIDPSVYNDADTFFGDYTCSSFLRKYEGLQTGVDTKDVALSAFNKCAQKCSAVNDRFLSYSTTGQIDQVEPSILARVQQLISSVWGDPTFQELFRLCGWGPGSTASLSGARATSEGKMSEVPMSVTPSALPYLRQVMSYDFAWLRHLLRCPVDGPASLLPQYYKLESCSRLMTVPKDAKTDRVIAAEPTGNIFLQKGVGGYIRKRLRKYGVNLDDQSRNQLLAKDAGKLSLATLDLSAASDTISIGLCKVLLPPDMFSLLDALRSPSYKLGEDIVRFHMFSSMGNGFTFELESLIFWAAAKAVSEYKNCQDPIGVYGDDIIVSQVAAEELIQVLEGFGFEINRRKSYVSGRFFESCGKHYFDGLDVTPVFQKRVVDNDLETSRCYNRVFDVAYLRCFSTCAKFARLHSQLISSLPIRLKKFRAPWWTEGDGFFRVINFTGKFSMNKGYCIYFMQASKVKEIVADGGLYALAIRNGSERQPVVNFLSEKLEATATGGFVRPRPQGRIRTYYRAKRWVPLLYRRELTDFI